jgi:hypothetical protein
MVTIFHNPEVLQIIELFNGLVLSKTSTLFQAAYLHFIAYFFVGR